MLYSETRPLQTSIKYFILGTRCGVKPFQLHGFGMHPCVSEGVCFYRGAEVELHPYSMDVRVIFPVVVTKIDEILKSEFLVIISF